MNASTPLSNAAHDKLARSGASNISNSLLKRGLRNTFLLGLQPLEPSQIPLVGPAFTMRFIPAREDLDSMALYQRDDSLHRRAIEECPANAVLVMSTGNDTRVSCMGDMMALRLKIRGVAGVVTDGGFRDSPGIRSTGLPCFQRETSGPATPITLHPVLQYERFRSPDQMHRLTFNGIWQLPYGFQASGLYFFADNGKVTPLSGVDVLGVGGIGAPPAQASPTPGRLRANGTIIERNSFDRSDLHRVDVRLLKRFTLTSRVALEGTVEVFNLFNHENYNAFVTNEAARNYGAPSFDSSIAFQPRTAQFGFRVTF